MTDSPASEPLVPPAAAVVDYPTPPPPEIKPRNYAKVYVAMVLEETLTRDAGLFWEALATQPIPGIEIVRGRIEGYGLAKARNFATWLAQRTDCGKFVFVDSDNKPSVAMLERLISHQEQAVSGFYPKKRMDKLEWVGNLLGGGAQASGLTEVIDFGAGFCCIDLALIDQMCAHYHESTWFISEDEPAKGKVMHDLWSNGPVTDDWYGRRFPRYLTEDFYFCWRIRKMGVKVWMDTLCQVGHIGPIDYLELHTRLKELENQSIYRAPSGG